jgi:plastocyanin
MLVSASGFALPLLGCQHKKLDKDLTVAMGGEKNELVFIKDRLRIAAGSTVTWILQSTGHTATAFHPDTNNRVPLRIPEGAEPFDSPLIFERGETYEWTFEQEGVYNYYCRPHEGSGMVGIVVVGNPIDGPGLVDPQPEISLASQNKLKELVSWAKGLPNI